MPEVENIQSSPNADTGYPELSAPVVLAIRNVSVRTRSGQMIFSPVTLDVHQGEILGILGPSGAGKSTFLKCLNRLIDLQDGLVTEGDIFFHDESINQRSICVDTLRARVGMIFQQPVLFPGSIRNNVLFGVRHQRWFSKSEANEIVENALVSAALWNEVRDRLDQNAANLSVGQRQRLCLARTLAMKAEVILMDEPTSALDSEATRKIEDLILTLRGKHTIVIVTHDTDQARRVTDRVVCACVNNGVGTFSAPACCDAYFSDQQCVEQATLLETQE